MGDKKETGKPSTEVKGTQVSLTSKVEPAQKEVDLSKYVPIEEHRAFQSKKDREVADAQRRVQELEAQMQREREEFLQAVDKQPELKANYELSQLRAKAAQYDQAQQASERLNQAKRQYAELFGVEADDLASATTATEAFALARKLEKEKLIADLKVQLGIKGEVKLEGEEAPDVSISQGPAPDATLVAETEWEKKRQEVATAIKDPKTRKRDRERARLDYLKASVQGPGKGRRSQI